MTSLCLSCNASLQHASLGRKSKYCSSACRQADYRLRKACFNRQRLSTRQINISNQVLTMQKQDLQHYSLTGFHLY